MAGKNETYWYKEICFRSIIISKITIKKFNSFFNKNFKVLRRMDRDCKVESETRHSPPLSIKIPFKWLFLFKLFEREQRLASLWTYLQCTYQLIN